MQFLDIRSCQSTDDLVLKIKTFFCFSSGLVLLSWNGPHKPSALFIFPDMWKWFNTHHVNTINGTQLQSLTFGIKDNVDHGADLNGDDVGGGVQQYPLTQVLLEGGESPKTIR